MTSAIRSQTQYNDQTFKGLQLKGVQLVSAEFYECTFTDCAFIETVFQNCRLNHCTFQGCDLSLLQVPDCRFSATRFEDCKLLSVNWTEANWSTASLGDPLSFVKCILSHSTFIGLELKGIRVVECIARDVDFREAVLTQADFSGSELSESLFSQTNLTGADLSTARNYHIAPQQNTLKGAKFSLPEAMSLLYNLDIDLSEGEEETNGDSLSTFEKKVVGRLLEYGESIDPSELFPTMIPEAQGFALKNPYAFAIATCLDRGTKADLIWTIPFDINQMLGHLDPWIIQKMTLAELEALFASLPRKPRYTNAAPRTLKELTRIVVEEFEGDASLIWKGKRAGVIKQTFKSVYGVGPQIANMSVILLEKAFGIYFDDLDRPSMDVKADVHTIRVLHRLGVSTAMTVDATIETARRLHPAYPAKLDSPLWLIGRKWCEASNPNCPSCPMDDLCKKVGV